MASPLAPPRIKKNFDIEIVTHIGDVVAWYPPGTRATPGSERYVAAMVTRVNADGTLTLSGYGVGSPYLSVDGAEAVPHISNEEKLAQQGHRCGCWDVLPQVKDLAQRLAALESLIDK